MNFSLTDSPNGITFVCVMLFIIDISHVFVSLFSFLELWWTI